MPSPKITTKIKSMPVIFNLNAAIKSHATIKKYKSLCDFYQLAQDELDVKSEQLNFDCILKQKLESRKLNIRNKSGGLPKILYVGSDREQDYSGFLQSLEKVAKVYTFTKPNGDYGYSYDFVRGKAAEKVRDNNGCRLLEIVNSIQENGDLDLVLGQMWNRTMPWQILKTIQDMGMITVNICMDDRHTFRGRKYKGQWFGTVGLIRGLDLVLTTAPEACLWYAVEGCPAVFWPEASDPNIFQPMDIPQKHDVCFVGANYGIRAKVVRTVEKRGVTVACYGNGWPNGRIATEDVPQLFAESKIVLGVGAIGYCEDFYSLKLRDFDGPMSGSLYLTHDNPDLRKLYDVGKEIVTYRTPEECAEKVVYYLNYPEQASSIAGAGYDRAVREHTWDMRFKQLFDILELHCS